MNISPHDLGGITVFCNDTHKFGSDAVLLSDFAFSNKSKVICDLGCGCGIIPLLLLKRNPNLKITAVDIQADAIKLVEKAVKENGLLNNLFPLLKDLRNLPKKDYNKYDLVTTNPPYKKAGAGIMSNNEGLNIARFEIKCSFTDIAKTAFKLLKPMGRFCLCHRPERLTDIIYELRQQKLEPKRLRLVYQRAGLQPTLVLVEGIKLANSGMKIMPDLFIENIDGEISEEIKRIYTPWYNEKDLI